MIVNRLLEVAFYSVFQRLLYNDYQQLKDWGVTSDRNRTFILMRLKADSLSTHFICKRLSSKIRTNEAHLTSSGSQSNILKKSKTAKLYENTMYYG